MIGVDWGTTSFRAWRLGRDGAVLGARVAARGILNVQDGDFANALRELCGDWLAEGEERVLLCGMIGSRQGWAEAPYLPCPAGAAELAEALVEVPFAGAHIRLVPGLSAHDRQNVPEVMRGEETQIAGLDSADGLVCLPGSHSKWARVEAGRVVGFETYFSGETFAALRSATILGRMMPDAPTDLDAFDRGLARAGDQGHLLHHLFGVRSRGLAGALAPAASASYLSGLLIGHEVGAAMATGAHVTIVANAQLTALYTRAVVARGGVATQAPPEATARGLARIGARTWP
ncbi:MAG: 2-dehydro-3-deoxygalactonokinase [Rhodospirillales bacterium]|nr:2-dehydro-3-deoxygalactonokinase [Rhodospirillales bacterium]